MPKRNPPETESFLPNAKNSTTLAAQYLVILMGFIRKFCSFFAHFPTLHMGFRRCPLTLGPFPPPWLVSTPNGAPWFFLDRPSASITGRRSQPRWKPPNPWRQRLGRCTNHSPRPFCFRFFLISNKDGKTRCLKKPENKKVYKCTYYIYTYYVYIYIYTYISYYIYMYVCMAAIASIDPKWQRYFIYVSTNMQ